MQSSHHEYEGGLPTDPALSDPGEVGDDSYHATDEDTSSAHIGVV